MKRSILELARVVRSKNAGPYELTLDIIFRDAGIYRQIRDGNRIDRALIAGLYGIQEGAVQDIIYFDPASAVKIVLPRRIVSGSAGDTDVYGAQQHAPLLNIEFDFQGD